MWCTVISFRHQKTFAEGSLTWWQVTPLVALGQKRQLTEDDFKQLPHEDETAFMTQKVEEAWQEQLTRPEPSLAKAFCRAYLPRILHTNVLLALECAVQVVSPFLLSRLVRGLQEDADARELYLYGMGLSISIFL
jgi:hypothetical protein